MVNRMIVLAATALVCLGPVACHSNGDGLVRRSADPPTPQELATPYVDALQSQLDTIVRDATQAEPPVLSESFSVEGIDVAVASGLLDEIYAARAGEPVFVGIEGLTEAGQTVLDVLRDAWAHGLFPEDYGVDAIDRAFARIDEARALLANPEPITLSETGRAAVIDALAARPELFESGADSVREALIEIVLQPADPETVPAPVVYGAHLRHLDAAAEIGVALAEIEQHLAAGLLRYAWDMRFANEEWFHPPEAEDEEVATGLLQGLQREALADTFVSGASGGFGPVLAALPPTYEQYGRLVEAHRRYREIVAGGGWRTDVEEVDIRTGDEHDVVVRLRERLAAEGYFDGDLASREYDRELRSAFIHYQETHQFRGDGRLSSGEVDSLNTSALERARQIAVTLARWRSSHITDDATFVFVNVPDFHAEMWRDLNRDRRMRIIVGSTQRFRSRESGEMVYPRATPEVHRPLRFLVFNPYWNVPPGIMINEYDPLLEEDPKWYENNGFEVLYNERGIRWVRQLPGPENALGFVKFLFPNDHDVYLHDTPNRHLFERTQRTFSHGCMRLEDPLDFAYYLLEHDRGWEPERVDEERADGEEQWVTLRTSIPVHVEYYVVRVDDDGWTHFNGDIYRRDVDAMEALSEREEARAVASAGRLLDVPLRQSQQRAEARHAEIERQRGATAATDPRDEPSEHVAVD